MKMRKFRTISNKSKTNSMEVLWARWWAQNEPWFTFCQNGNRTYDDICICTCTQTCMYTYCNTDVCSCFCLMLLLLRIRTHTQIYLSVSLRLSRSHKRTLCPCSPRCTPYANETLQRKRGIGRINIHTYSHYMFMYSMCMCVLFLKTLPMMDVLGRKEGPGQIDRKGTDCPHEFWPTPKRQFQPPFISSRQTYSAKIQDSSGLIM